MGYHVGMTEKVSLPARALTEVTQAHAYYGTLLDEEIRNHRNDSAVYANADTGVSNDITATAILANRLRVSEVPPELLRGLLALAVHRLSLLEHQ